MKKEILENAMTEIDAAYLCEAAESTVTQGKPHRRPIGRILLIAAAVIVLLVTGISAASPVDLSFYLDKAFHGGYDLIDGITSVPRNVFYSSSGDEIRLEMKGIVGDTQTVMVFYDITVQPESGLTDKELLFNTDMEPVWSIFNLPKSGSYGYNRQELGHTVMEDGSVVYQMCVTFENLDLKSGDNMFGDDMMVTLTSVASPDYEAKEKKTLLTGKWRMVFTLDYEDVTKIIPCDAEIMPEFIDLTQSIETTASYPLHMREIRLSPLSLTVICDYDAAVDVSGMEFTEVGIQYRDGSCVPDSAPLRTDTGMHIVGEDGAMRYASAQETDVWRSRNKIVASAGADISDPENPDRRISMRIWRFSSQIDYENAAYLLLGGEAVAIQ